MIPSHSTRRRSIAVAAACLSVASLTAGTATVAQAHEHAPRHDRLQKTLQNLVRDDGFPAAIATVRDSSGRSRSLAAGVQNVRTGAPAKADGRVRLGSNSKTFVSVVVLQLVAEGKVRLDAPVETYLPGVVRGPDYDGRHITVRQLLQHTSGLPDYVVSVLGDSFASVQHTYYDPHDLLAAAFKQKADFPAGTSWTYSNTNYVLLGLLVQRVTGRPLGEEITSRILHRIGLHNTYFPTPGDQRIIGPHPHGYDADQPGQPLRDVTVMDPSWGWSAGSMIGTPSDLNRFFRALLDGRLLPAAQLREMKTTVSTHGGLWAGARYGLGLISTPLTCGGLAWGHGGDIEGYETRDAATTDGRAVTIAVTALPAALPNSMSIGLDPIKAVDTALCSVS